MNKLLASVFAVMLPQVEFRKVIPADYRLFQVADLFCTLELVSLKYEKHDSVLMFHKNLLLGHL